MVNSACGHIALCIECVERINRKPDLAHKCIICKQVGKYIKVFYSWYL
jgi:hypothetical protein